MVTTSSAIQAAMLNDNNRLTVISQNIANASTTGYKRKISVDNSFSEYMTLYTANNGLQQPNSEIKVGLPYLETKIDSSMGSLIESAGLSGLGREWQYQTKRNKAPG